MEITSLQYFLTLLKLQHDLFIKTRQMSDFDERLDLRLKPPIIPQLKIKGQSRLSFKILIYDQFNPKQYLIASNTQKEQNQ